jgi:hypothetical protein
MTLVDLRSRTGYPSLSSRSWVKKTASLTSRVRARPSSPGTAGLGGPLDPLDRQPDAADLLQQAGCAGERPGRRGDVVHRGQAR